MKATITKINRYDKDKNGKPYENSRGPYKKIRMTTQETGEKVLSGFEDSVSASWNPGSVIEIEVEEVVVNGNTYYNFKRPNMRDEMEKRVKTLEMEMEGVKKDIAALKAGNDTPTETEPSFDDIPF